MAHADDLPPLPQGSHLEKLGARVGASWPSIAKAHARATAKREGIRKRLDRQIHGDTTFVAFGSLARGELTEQSDLDWALLVDGQADEAHLTTAQRIQQILAELGLGQPGPTGVFGGPAFSHEIVHRIGLDADSNQNTTRRILLLLEPTSIGPWPEVRERVITQLLKRYVEDDHGYRTSLEPHVPRFLLNDIVRYWRTIAVDFAAKRRERGGQGWALRRFKLRMSRKLIFSAGLVACLSCKLWPSEGLRDAKGSEQDLCSAMVEHLLPFADMTPLEILAFAVLRAEADEAGRLLFDAYDSFLDLISDDDRRRELQDLPADHPESTTFAASNEIADSFQDGLTRFFFDTDPDLTNSTQRYGVF